jgi:hypothetical protein
MSNAVDLFGDQPHDAGGRSKPMWPAGSVVAARFGGPHDCYRYELSEVWDATKPLVMWLMMNPSVASVTHADPTLIRTGNFARSWGYGGQLIGNVHAYRATDAARLLEVEHPAGPDNDDALLSMALRSHMVILAYGQPPRRLRGRADGVVAVLARKGARLTYLARSKDGTPKHPLYLPGCLTPLDWPHTPPG